MEKIKEYYEQAESFINRFMPRSDRLKHALVFLILFDYLRIFINDYYSLIIVIVGAFIKELGDKYIKKTYFDGVDLAASIFIPITIIIMKLIN
jgi:hypothetical protein